MEAPDVIGFPSVELVKGRQVTVHHTPDFWPSEGEGVLMLEEPNRGTTSVMNTFMQLLTDRQIHKYEFPKGWMIVGCINPENETNDVNTMDSALRNRFVTFKVNYDKRTFLDYMKAKDWDETLQAFVETGTWNYVAPEDLDKSQAGNKYISPRTFEQLNAALQSGLSPAIELEVFSSILGTNVGRAFAQFKNNDAPITYEDIANEKSRKKAFKKLKEFSDPKNYRNSYIAFTVKSIVEAEDVKKGVAISDDLLSEVLLTIPADQAYALLMELQFKRNDQGMLTRIWNNYPELAKQLKNTLSKNGKNS